MLTVSTKKGMIKGIPKDGYTLFLGIPYAKPPIGPLRWRPPQETDTWDGVYSATSFPNRSMQADHRNPFYDKEFYDEPERETPFSEDGLYLNIWTPAKQAGESLPVAFWIHGGAFLGGNGHEKEFDGEAYCAQGVILVTINYRVGPMGFLAHPWLSEEDRALGGAGVSGNYGILDQIAALKWVYQNIDAFGGDPGNITVFGQSAGCKSVQALVSSPLASGLIAKAILQSGLGTARDCPLSVAELNGLEFSRIAGVHSLREMRSLTCDQILSAAAPLIAKGFSSGSPVYSPSIDNVLLGCSSCQALEQGLIHNIPYMVGSTLNDIQVSSAELANGNRGVVYEACKHWCESQLKNDRKPSYLYYFTRQLPGDDAGAFHSSELWYMFGTMNRCWRPFTDRDLALSADMVRYWTNFMKNGDPNGPGLSPWSPYRSEDDIKIFDV